MGCCRRARRPRPLVQDRAIPWLGLILDRLGPTLQLTGGALLLALVVAVPLGVLAAVRRGSIWDTLGSAVSLFGVSFPSFWLGIMLILLFSEAFRLLPPSGLSEYGREADLGSRACATRSCRR